MLLSSAPPPLESVLGTPEQEVAEGQDGAAEKESQVAADLPDEAGPVAHDVLGLVFEQKVLEPQVHSPVGVVPSAL